MQEEFSKGDLVSAVGALITSERESAELTVAKAAESFGIHRGVFGTMERGGQELFMEQLIELTHVLNTDLARFFPEPSTVGTPVARSIASRELIPNSGGLVKAVKKYGSEKRGTYLGPREPESKKPSGNQPPSARRSRKPRP